MNNKVYKIPQEDIKTIIQSNLGCIASDKVTVDGEKVGYMYREEPDEDYDSGWRFFPEVKIKNTQTMRIIFLTTG